MKPTEKQMQSRMIDVHYSLLSWIANGNALRDLQNVSRGTFRAASTLLRWEAITPATKDEANRITPVGQMLVKHWIDSHASGVGIAHREKN